LSISLAARPVKTGKVLWMKVSLCNQRRSSDLFHSAVLFFQALGAYPDTLNV